MLQVAAINLSIRELHFANAIRKPRFGVNWSSVNVSALFIGRWDALSLDKDMLPVER